MNSANENKSNELFNKIVFTLLMLFVCRIGSYIPIAGINSYAMNEVANQNQPGILGMFNMLSGGSLGRMSIFALAIMPYITSSIIITLLSSIHEPLMQIKKQGESGRKKINQYTRYLTVLLAAVQAFGIAASLEKMSTSVGGVVINPGYMFKITTISTLVVGTMFLMWVGEQISSRGIGNGTSLIIFTGIVSGLPASLARTFELSRTGIISSGSLVLIVAALVGVIALIVFFERAHRKVLIQYSKRQTQHGNYNQDSTHLPIKLNVSGVIPPIFASALLLFPLTIASFMQSDSGIMQSLVIYLGHGKPLYIVLYIALIVLFAFVYTAFVFNTQETAENLKKNSAFIPGRRPGAHTAEYLDYLIVRITVLGAAYLSFICVLPEVFMAKYSIPFNLGGTGLLIVVNVVIDTFTQIQSYMYSQRYDSLVKKAKLRVRR